MKKKIMLLTVLIVAALDAGAKSVTFDAYINSSGNSMYVCNAGLWHKADNLKCYTHEGQECNPDCGKNPNCQSCICPGANGGAYLNDFAAVQAHNWVEDNERLGAGVGKVSDVRGPNLGGWNQVYSDDEAFNHILSSVTFNFGSEQYGACYFVDTCFRGSQIKYDNIIDPCCNANYPDVPAPHALTAKATVTDIASSTNNLSYVNLSGLRGWAVYSCDREGVGQQNHPADVIPVINIDIAKIILNVMGSNYTVATSGGESGSVGVSSFNNFSTAQTATYFSSKYINNSSDAPRFCKVRYYFCETNRSALRKWQLHQAKACLFTNIEEGVEEGL